MKRAALLLALAACRQDEPAITAPFSDRFEGATPAAHWLNTGGPYRIDGGALRVSHGYNHPLWLARKLPRDAELRFTARSDSPAGDLKVEAWGDGRSFAESRGAYTSSGYVFIFGGWSNRLTVLARMDEHGADRKERADLRVEPGRSYRWRIRRQGSRVAWWIDDRLVFELDDPEPLAGPGHAHFAFNDWESDVRFDDLAIEPVR